MDIVIGRAAINQAACRIAETKFVLSFSLATAVNGVLEYTPRVIYTLCRLAVDPWGPAFSYTLYICGAFTILATGPGQVLFFIDSFERAFGHAGHFKPRAADFQPACERRQNRRKRAREGERKRGRERKGKEGANEENGESARCKIKDDGNLIEIVAILTHSGAAVV